MVFRSRPKVVVENNVPKKEMDIMHWAESPNENMEISSPCGETTTTGPLFAPADFRFRITDNPECDGCKIEIAATTPKGNEQIRLQIGKEVTFRGRCPFSSKIER